MNGTVRHNYLTKFRLDGKVAVVAGGLGLLGKETAVALAQAGAKVLVLDISVENGARFQQESMAEGLNIIFIHFDVTKTEEYKNRLDTIFRDVGLIDVWVNTAYPRTDDWGNKVENVRASSWQENVNTQMNSYCLLTVRVAELMKEHNVKGSIINLGSTYGVVGPDFEVYSGTEMTCPAAYAAVKGGTINFSRYAASYYGKYGIRVNCLCPGGIFDNQNPTFVKSYEQRTPLRRMGKADEIAAAALFLASDAASYITGTTFMVDGGWTCI